MAYIYPKTIKGTTGWSIANHSQQLSNKSNLCSGNTSLAYWGVKVPLFVGNYMRNYPDSVTTLSGSYNKPETFIATDWDTNLPDTWLVEKITIEYKWEQISYSCGTWDCYGRFDKPTLTLKSKNDTLATWKGAKPEAIRYNNNKNNPAKMNTNTGELATLHKNTFDLTSKKMTIADLKKMQLIFNPAPNTYTNHCRIVMQFIRIEITYKEVYADPILQIESRFNPTKVNEHETYNYRAVVTNKNKNTKQTTCNVKIGPDINIDQKSISCPNGAYEPSIQTWTINKFNDNNQAILTFNATSNNVGTKYINAAINKYADSVKNHTEAKIEVIPNNVYWKIGIVNQYAPYNFLENQAQKLYVSITRDQDTANRNESVVIDTDGWITDPDTIWIVNKVNQTNNVVLKDSEKGIWEISNLTGKTIEITTRNNIDLKVGTYNIFITHKEKGRQNEQKSLVLNVIGEGYAKDYFKLRLEDGSDVRYNSLMFSPGDDLTYPLEYSISNIDDFKEQLMLVGEKKRLPTKEARFVGYDITLKSDLYYCNVCGNIEEMPKIQCSKCQSMDVIPYKKTYENVLCLIDIIDADNSEDSSDIIISSDAHTQLLTQDVGNTDTNMNQKLCVIDQLVTNETKHINFVVQSDVPKRCICKLKPLNYDEYATDKWTPSCIEFNDIPNVKISIEATKDDMEINDEVTIKYIVENRSNVDGHNLRFKIKEPPSFEVVSSTFTNSDLENELIKYDYTLTEEEKNKNWFNDINRMITFATLEGQQTNPITGAYTPKQYILTITYRATQKGIFDFILETYDNPSITEDDQWENVTKQKIMVGIDNHIDAYTSINKTRPYVNELVDFKIHFKNYDKKQDVIQFEIKSKDNDDRKDYYIEYYNLTIGTFTPSDDLETIGTWTINSVDINDEEELNLTMRFVNTGGHNITTNMSTLALIDTFYHDIVVLEDNKQMEFNVYHAIGDLDSDCSNCDLLTEICDDDFINIDDEIYYVVKVTNNNRNAITTNTHIYARLPESFYVNKDLICCTPGISYSINENTGLLSFIIPNIKSCSTVTFCFKVQPHQMGDYISNFMLTNRNAHVYHKQLTLHVDSDFDQNKIEHEITIYNFDKTNRYYRYELDGNNTIFKFFNTGDKSVRTVDIEGYNKGGIERYKGTNLDLLVRDIKQNSKFVEPELLRFGSNKLADKGYELCPDGFIRRFGLLNSEIFHYAGQLPEVGHMSDYAMKWDIDSWDTKVWGGDPYENGVFHLSIDYDKIPKNFNIFDANNSLNNLQTVVNRVKPFGTKAICLYANTIHLGLKMNVLLENTLTNVISDLYIPIPQRLGLISLYDRHDNTLAYYYDLFNIKLNSNALIDPKHSLYTINEKDPDFTLNTSFEYTMDVFDKKYEKKYICDCFDIVRNLYYNNNYVKNIDIYKAKVYNGVNGHITHMVHNKEICTVEYIKGQEDFTVNIGEDVYQVKYVVNNFNDFAGFIVTKNNNIIYSYNTEYNPTNTYIQLQSCIDTKTKKRVIHFWVNINKYYYHIGYIIAKDSVQIVSSNNLTYEFAYDESYQDTPIFFEITDRIKTKRIDPAKVVQFNDNSKWKNLNNIFEDGHYASFSNDVEIDTDCKDLYITTPTIAVKYNDFDFSNNDEILDIGLKLKAHSNKENFADDISIKMHKNGDAYIPENKVARSLHYPTNIVNINQEFLSNIIVQQPNISLCNNCLTTQLGYYDECPVCHSYDISHHHDKKAITACENCNWIEDGWHDYCTHCSSQDVVKTKVDYNKTYCYHCQTLSGDYYQRCPYCFSKNVLHLNNDEHRYKLEGEDSQNINPVVIKTDTNRINVFNIKVPINMYTQDIDLLEKLDLHIYGSNNNQGFFTYCEKCHSVEFTSRDKCMECGSTNITEHRYNNVTMDIYCKTHDQNNNVVTEKIVKLDDNTDYDKLDGEFDIPIDILSIAKENKEEYFVLMFYIENLYYDKSINEIQTLNTSEENIDKLLSAIPIMDINIDNLYLESKYQNENEWQGLKNLEEKNHTYIYYNTKKEDQTDYLNFKNFDIKPGTYDNLYLYVAGINKSDTHAKMNVFVDINDNTYAISDEYIDPDLFSLKLDLSKFIHEKIQTLSVRLNFTKISNNTQMIITHCYIMSEKTQEKNIFDTTIKKEKTQIVQNDDTIYIKSNKKVWGLEKEAPYYIDGRQLITNLVCYIDFGKLNANEYIRLYDTDLLITYKNRYGKIITDTINLSNEKYTKEMVSGDLQKYKAESWGLVKSSNYILNNLESNFLYDDDEEKLTAIPLHNQIAQAFTIPTSNISQIEIEHFARAGYPEEEITVEIYNDEQGQIGKKLYSTQVNMPFAKETVTVDINVEDINPGEQYWLVLKDDKADKHNYHRFTYSTKTNKSIQTTSQMQNIGVLLITKDGQTTVHRQASLSMNVLTGFILSEFYSLPVTLDLDSSTNFKLHQNFYRYNTNSINNAHLTDYTIKTGYEYRG